MFCHIREQKRMVVTSSIWTSKF